MKETILWIIEISIIALIPIIGIFYDNIEDTTIYKSFFKFDVIENVITYNFAEYGTLDNNATVKRQLYKTSDKEEFSIMYNLIKRHTLVKIPEEEAMFMQRGSIENSPYVTLPHGKYLIIPDTVPILVGYCPGPAPLPAKCVISVGTLEDVKNWYFDEKKNIRNNVQTSIGITAIILGLIIWNIERKKSYLLLEK